MIEILSYGLRRRDHRDEAQCRVDPNAYRPDEPPGTLEGRWR